MKAFDTGFRDRDVSISPRTWSLTDDELREISETAEVAPLIAALVALTGDVSALIPQARPATPEVGAVITAQGGLDDESLDVARREVRRLLGVVRQAPGRFDGWSPDRVVTSQLIEYLTGVGQGQAMAMLERELGRDPRPGERGPDERGARARSVVVIGAGLSGVAAAHKLSQAGHRVRVLESAAAVGGTWLKNTYPGCRLDTANYAYSFSFAPKPDWSDHYSEQPSVLGYAQALARDTGVEHMITFRARVDEATWREDSASWFVTYTDLDTMHEHTIEAEHVVTAVGQLDRPKIPALPGLETFRGAVVHSAEWDRSIDLRGKNVALVGTGASAFQLGPAIAQDVESLRVFQRSAPWMLPTPEYHSPIDGWLEWLMRELPGYARWYRFWQFWIAVEARRPLVTVDPDWDRPGSVSAENQRLREELESRLRKQFADRPDLLPLVIPTYPPGSKRMLRDNGVWGNMLRSNNVEVVTDPLSAITASGLLTEDGTEHPVDVLIFATGFQADDFLAPMRFIGVDGADLHETWGGDAKAYATTHVPGFPNLHLLVGPNSGLAANGSILFMSECASDYVVACLDELERTGNASLEPTHEATERFCAEIDRANELMAWGVKGVSTWYQNRFGRVSQNWPLALADYWAMTRSPRADDYRWQAGPQGSTVEGGIDVETRG